MHTNERWWRIHDHHDDPRGVGSCRRSDRESAVCGSSVTGWLHLAVQPVSDQVTISRGTVLYVKLQSASNGVFTVDLPPGIYNFDASTNFTGVSATARSCR